MKKGDKVRINLHGHNQMVDATVTAVLKDGFIKATINDDDHPLTHVDDKKREITCSDDMYEEQ